MLGNITIWNLPEKFRTFILTITMMATKLLFWFICFLQISLHLFPKCSYQCIASKAEQVPVFDTSLWNRHHYQLEVYTMTLCYIINSWYCSGLLALVYKLIQEFGTCLWGTWWNGSWADASLHKATYHYLSLFFYLRCVL